MKITLEADDEILDEFFADGLKWHIDYISEELDRLRKMKNKKRHLTEDCAYFSKLLPALELVGEYYGVK